MKIMVVAMGLLGLSARAENAPSFEQQLLDIGRMAAARRAHGDQPVFTRVIDRPQLGDAWKDNASNLIWGDLVTHRSGVERFMTQQAAAEYCRGIGARLPREAEFYQLAQSLNDGGERALPNMIAHTYWTSTLNAQTGDAVSVIGYSGDGWRYGRADRLSSAYQAANDQKSTSAVRCVAD